jgi:hypothetical protein
MGVFDELLKCASYKAVYMHESHSAYIWQDGVCKYYQHLTQDQVNTLKSLSELAQKKFNIPNKAFGFTS